MLSQANFKINLWPIWWMKFEMEECNEKEKRKGKFLLKKNETGTYFGGYEKPECKLPLDQWLLGALLELL